MALENGSLPSVQTKDMFSNMSRPFGHQRAEPKDPISINYPDDEARKHAC